MNGICFKFPNSIKSRNPYGVHKESVRNECGGRVKYSNQSRLSEMMHTEHSFPENYARRVSFQMNVIGWLIRRCLPSVTPVPQPDPAKNKIK